MSGGEALEGLDTIGEMGTNLIIVFNDNNQSIAEVHGGMYKQFAKLRETHGQYPHNLFRAMGLDYRFVEHGNDTEELIRVFREVKDIDHPIVIHVVTRKGLGYKPAEENKEKWHSCRGFNIATGEKIGKGPNPYFDTTASYLLHRMKWDHRLAAIAAATPSNFGFTPDKRKEAGNQYIDVGIAEEQDCTGSRYGFRDGKKWSSSRICHICHLLAARLRPDFTGCMYQQQSGNLPGHLGRV